ncbi:MAG: type II toxin-antitoxin system RelE/ParE family toxin [Rhodospirillales bacterium]|nr:type II toxin-antitoxin system RelE/ParE family toxin [Rhodospirillales bacterium]
MIWSPRAATTYRREVLDYLEQQGEPALRRVTSDIERTIEILAQRPIGRPGRVSGTYEKLVVGQPYIVVYALTRSDDGEEDNPVIMRIVHTVRDWPPGRWPR